MAKHVLNLHRSSLHTIRFANTNSIPYRDNSSCPTERQTVNSTSNPITIPPPTTKMPGMPAACSGVYYTHYAILDFEATCDKQCKWSDPSGDLTVQKAKEYAERVIAEKAKADAERAKTDASSSSSSSSTNKPSGAAGGASEFPPVTGSDPSATQADNPLQKSTSSSTESSPLYDNEIWESSAQDVGNMPFNIDRWAAKGWATKGVGKGAPVEFVEQNSRREESPGKSAGKGGGSNPRNGPSHARLSPGKSKKGRDSPGRKNDGGRSNRLNSDRGNLGKSGTSPGGSPGKKGSSSPGKKRKGSLGSGSFEGDHSRSGSPGRGRSVKAKVKEAHTIDYRNAFGKGPTQKSDSKPIAEISDSKLLASFMSNAADQKAEKSPPKRVETSPQKGSQDAFSPKKRTESAKKRTESSLKKSPARSPGRKKSEASNSERKDSAPDTEQNTGDNASASNILKESNEHRAPIHRDSVSSSSQFSSRSGSRDEEGTDEDTLSQTATEEEANFTADTPAPTPVYTEGSHSMGKRSGRGGQKNQQNNSKAANEGSEQQVKLKANKSSNKPGGNTANTNPPQENKGSGAAGSGGNNAKNASIEFAGRSGASQSAAQWMNTLGFSYSGDIEAAASGSGSEWKGQAGNQWGNASGNGWNNQNGNQNAARSGGNPNFNGGNSNPQFQKGGSNFQNGFNNGSFTNAYGGGKGSMSTNPSMNQNSWNGSNPNMSASSNSNWNANANSWNSSGSSQRSNNMSNNRTTNAMNNLAMMSPNGGLNNSISSSGSSGGHNRNGNSCTPPSGGNSSRTPPSGSGNHTMAMFLSPGGTGGGNNMNGNQNGAYGNGTMGGNMNGGNMQNNVAGGGKGMWGLLQQANGGMNNGNGMNNMMGVNGMSGGMNNGRNANQQRGMRPLQQQHLQQQMQMQQAMQAQQWQQQQMQQQGNQGNNDFQNSSSNLQNWNQNSISNPNLQNTNQSSSSQGQQYSNGGQFNGQNQTQHQNRGNQQNGNANNETQNQNAQQQIQRVQQKYSQQQKGGSNAQQQNSQQQNQQKGGNIVNIQPHQNNQKTQNPNQNPNPLQSKFANALAKSKAPTFSNFNNSGPNFALGNNIKGMGVKRKPNAVMPPILKKNKFVQEIIEFPTIIVNASTLKVEEEYRQYVRPIINPNVSDFCTQLTGIRQEHVDRYGRDFAEVFIEWSDWLRRKYPRCLLITCGDWDLNLMLPQQIKLRLSDEARIAEERTAAEECVDEIEGEIGVDGILWIGAGNGDTGGECNSTHPDAILTRHNLVRMLTEMDTGTVIGQMTQLLQRAAANNQKLAESATSTTEEIANSISAVRAKNEVKKPEVNERIGESIELAKNRPTALASDLIDLRAKELQSKILKLNANFDERRKEIYEKRVRFAHAVLAHSEPWSAVTRAVNTITTTMPGAITSTQNLKGGSKGGKGGVSGEASTTGKGSSKGFIGLKGDAASAQAAAERLKLAAEEDEKRRKMAAEAAEKKRKMNLALQSQIARATSPGKSPGSSSLFGPSGEKRNLEGDHQMSAGSSRNEGGGGDQSPVKALHGGRRSSTRKSLRRGDLQSPVVSPTNASIAIGSTSAIKDGEHRSSSPSKKVKVTGPAAKGEGKGKSGKAGKTSDLLRKKRSESDDEDNSGGGPDGPDGSADNSSENDSSENPEDLDEALCCYVSDNEVTVTLSNGGKSEDGVEDMGSVVDVAAAVVEAVPEAAAGVVACEVPAETAALASQPSPIKSPSASPIKSPQDTPLTNNITRRHAGKQQEQVQVVQNVPLQMTQTRGEEEIPFVPTFTVRRWSNAKTIFEKSSLCEPWEKAWGMAWMLEKAGLPLLGRHHSGLDDCRNIARIVQALCKLKKREAKEAWARAREVKEKARKITGTTVTQAAGVDEHHELEKNDNCYFPPVLLESTGGITDKTWKKVSIAAHAVLDEIN